MASDLKNYQSACLGVLAKFLREARGEDRGGKGSAEKAFNQMDPPAPGRQRYRTVPGWNESGEFPYVCVRVPTGGGKTLMAAHAVGIAAREYLNTERHVVLWLAPSDTIVKQTLKVLGDRSSRAARALRGAFGGQVELMGVTEALSVKPADLSGACTVIVSTIQAWKVESKDGRKVYQPDNGALIGHFEGVPDAIMNAAGVERDPDGRPVLSLANVLKMRRPLVVVDEGHKFRTKLTFDTLKRLNPAAIIEFTATPYVEGGDRVPSNVLVEATAAHLKDEHMIKAPVVLKEVSGAGGWPEAVRLAVAKRNELHRLCEVEEKAGREYIRPIVLFQAQPDTGPEAITPERLRQHLLGEKIDAGEIVIHTGEKKDLPDDILSRECKVKYVITVQALGEGWDCPFAYVLCTITTLAASVAVEQMLGRVLRMPYVSRRGADALNQAYCYTSSPEFNRSAGALREALVDAGFSRDEAESMIRDSQGRADDIRQEQDAGASLFGALKEQAVFIDAPLDEPTRKALTEAVGPDATVRFEPANQGAATRVFLTSAPLAVPAITAVERVLSTTRDTTAAEKIRRAAAGEDVSPQRLEEHWPVAGLVIKADGRAALFDAQHKEVPWTLEGADAALAADEFDPSPGKARTTVFDPTKAGSWAERYQGELAETLLWEDQAGPKTDIELVAWLDEKVADVSVTQRDKRGYLQRAVAHLIGKRGLSIETLAPSRWRLAEALGLRIDHLRRKAAEANYQAYLSQAFVPDRTPGAAGVWDAAAVPRDYAALRRYTGPVVFDKHLIGGSIAQMNDPEVLCAQQLDAHPNVRSWLRNIENNPASFFFPLAESRFYPDFVAWLYDGRTVAIEYKGDRASKPEELVKLVIGQLWEKLSNGRNVFIWVTEDRLATAINTALATG